MARRHLYLIKREDAGDYDTYSDAVVVARDAEHAKHIHPGGAEGEWWLDTHPYAPVGKFGDWIAPDRVLVTYLGVVNRDCEFAEGRVVCASFHAG